ncbi:glycerate kinase [Chloroflexota bacterium]
MLRGAALDIAEHVLDHVNPYRLAREVVRLDGETLRVGDVAYDLGNRGDIYVLGAGKASLPIVQALEDTLGDRIRYGLLTVKEGQIATTRMVETREASHPLPDARGLKAAEDTLQLAAQARAGDIVFCAITGGSSALWPCPIAGMDIGDKREVHRLLLESGASIREINAVRKHLSRIKGGRLAAAILPAAIVNLTVSDVTGDPYDYITDPTVPDTSTFDDARAVLDRYSLWELMPVAAAKHLRDATPDMENPREFPDDAIHTCLLVPSDMVCTAAAEKAHSLGLSPRILTCEMEGDSQTEGKRFGAALSLVQQENETEAIAVIAGGETTVSVGATTGEGGPNQEFGLAAACVVAGDDQVVLSLDTDGTDGPTDLAGALVDSTTADRAAAMGFDMRESLRQHNASPLLVATADAVETGHTGTNVNDFKLGLAAPEGWHATACPSMGTLST